MNGAMNANGMHGDRPRDNMRDMRDMNQMMRDGRDVRLMQNYPDHMMDSDLNHFPYANNTMRDPYAPAKGGMGAMGGK
jgi:hypothetical protein